MPRLTRRDFLRAGLTGLAGAALWPGRAGAADPTRKMNVLFIAVDDLRPSMGCYGNRRMQSPHMDALAARGTLFERAYCQQAVCSPSRTSLLTGRRPDTTRVYDLETHFRKTIPDVVTLPQQFMRHGWHTQGLSKIYHGGLDDKASWSAPHWTPGRPEAVSARAKQIMAEQRKAAFAAGWDGKSKNQRPRGVPVDAPECADNALPDGATADRAIEVLNDVKDLPFFLATGFLKPHLPFIAPKKYWDLYKRDEFTPADNPYAPKDAPAYAATSWGELRAYFGMPKQGPVSDDQARELIHGYYAASSYTDAQIGRVVGELDRLGLRENTVVILWGDHGWHLGDHGFWCKHTNYESAVHAPLLVSAPGRNAARCGALVEFVDIYPSLCELCGVPLAEGLEGTSFKPLIDDPKRPWKKAVFSQYPRGNPKTGRLMGYSMRTDRHRFVEWRAAKGDFHEYELYDHATDPAENVNIANRPESRALAAELKRMMDAGWKGAAPEGV